MKHIASKDNQLVKLLLKLEKSRERKTQGLFVVEGEKEIILAMENGYEIQHLIYRDVHAHLHPKLERLNEYQVVTMDAQLFDKLTYRGEHIHLLAIIKAQPQRLSTLKLSDNPLLLIVESVEKPGNLGAILRTADACKADAVIVCDEVTDFYNPNVIRASVGTVFSVPKCAASNHAVLEWLQQHQITIFSTFIEQSIPYYDADFSQPCALLVGTEAQGLSPFWRKHASQNIIIPMLGQNDSLNVSAAVAILSFEARKAKNNSNKK